MTLSAPILRHPHSPPHERERPSTRQGESGQVAVVLLAAGDQNSADRATVCAARLAVALDAKLRIVHVVAPVQFRVGRLAPTRVIERRATDPFASDVLVRARDLAWRHGAAATLELIAGDMPQAVIDAARRVDADALVLSDPAHRGGFGRAGARRRWITQHAPCQIITPATAEQAAWP